ncbi:RidA family protein [Actinotalea ferrariae]|uniref:RidA family protein n=1 Tax=Actinotalea ferrariae TaxID=1386098 RepID=UPI001C8CD73D|nr:RidA family protein [Actinotalea ferrariae]MBX9246296.1 RidA family protein [Actinotalea ferrariae]
MTVELINPAGIPAPEAYWQMSVTQGSRAVYLSGQVARTAEGEPVGAGDLAAQTEQAYLNVGAALAAVDAGFDAIAKLTVYVVDYAPEKMGSLIEGAMRAGARLGVDVAKPITLLGVAALGEPDMLVEVEAIAVLP